MKTINTLTITTKLLQDLVTMMKAVYTIKHFNECVNRQERAF